MTDSETDEEYQIEEETEKYEGTQVEEGSNKEKCNEEEQQTEGNNEHEVEEMQVKKVTKCKTKRSWVWDHFTYVESIKKAKCHYCKNLFICNKGSTSGLSNHIKNKHKITKDQGKKQLTIHEAISNSNVTVSIKHTLLS